jgi:protein-tyrosine-phosphatase
MGCSAEDVCPATFVGENRDWDLDDPGDASREEARSIRDEVKGRVLELFDEIDG